MNYKIFVTDKFEKEMNKLSIYIRNQIENIFVQLKENPYVGDQIQIQIFREKRLKEKRIYYLVFDELSAVLIIAISNKKSQQKVIDYIIKNIGYYRGYLKNQIAH
jgi:mRNA-degrading endonuclease RelE of RelBE toxin-antitoxin system